MSTENLILNSTPVIHVSAEAERHARDHHLLPSLTVMKSLVLSGAPLIESVDVDLTRDPEATASFVICFSIQTAAHVPDILEFDKRLGDSMFDAIPPDDRAYFAVRFDFD